MFVQENWMYNVKLNSYLQLYTLNNPIVVIHDEYSGNIEVNAIWLFLLRKSNCYTVCINELTSNCR